MVILGIESSAKSASAAVVRDGRVLSQMFLNVGLTHSVTLMPLISSAIEKADVTVHDIDAIAVSAGPGSFTGIRIGVATAKGISQPEEKKCIGVSTLETIAYPLRDSDCIAAAVMDARCSQVYCALFDCENSEMTRLTEDDAFSFDTLLDKISKFRKKVILIGDGADVVYEYLKDKTENVYIASPLIRYQNAASVALIGEQRYKDNVVCTADELIPSYIRLPQAERELKKKKETV